MKSRVVQALLATTLLVGLSACGLLEQYQAESLAKDCLNEFKNQKGFQIKNVELRTSLGTVSPGERANGTTWLATIVVDFALSRGSTTWEDGRFVNNYRVQNGKPEIWVFKRRDLSWGWVSSCTEGLPY